MQILIVEDDPHLQTLLQTHFSREKWKTLVCDSGEQALQLVQQNSFDLAVIDWMLAGEMSGLDLCKRLAGDMRVVMLTSRTEPTDVVAALENGADDYVTKPFEAAILVARVRAVMRRQRAVNPQRGPYKIKNLEIDPDRFEVKCNGRMVELTPSEFGLLLTMVKNPGSVLSRQKLLSHIQSAGINVVERTIDTHVYTLRKKIGDCGDFIETIRGVGYRIHFE